MKLVERAVLDPKKEGKSWLREGNFDWYIFKKSIHILLDTRAIFFGVLDRYISEKPKGRANKSKERAKRRVGSARSKKEGKRRAWEGSSAAMVDSQLMNSYVRVNPIIITRVVLIWTLLSQCWPKLA